MADWLSDNLADWLRSLEGNEYKHQHDVDMFVQRCVLPHISSYGVNSMYEFMKDDYDDDECDIMDQATARDPMPQTMEELADDDDEVALNWNRMPNPDREGTN
jgi:stalled ribosome rescue protein Dom34|tara:strand:- start:1285 stop:1593 length:309 start_codon:yes stop_codon:yes gene_type:complete